MPPADRTHYVERDAAGRRWLIEEYSGTQGLDLILRLAEALAPLIGALPKGKLDADVELDFALVARALRDMGLARPETTALVKDLLATTQVRIGKGYQPVLPVFDEVFRGAAGLQALFEVLRHVWEANLAVPFLSSALRGASSAGVPRATPALVPADDGSPSPSRSSGAA